MNSLSRDLVFLILQFLDEEKFKDTIHFLEKESGLFFSMKHLEEMVLSGKWDELEKYLSGFTRLDDNRFSMKLFFEIRKQKYLEALDNRETPRAVEILVKDLKVFANFNEELYKEITHLLTYDNFRENDQLSSYRDARTARTMMLVELKRLVEANPIFREKLQFPAMRGSRLRLLINQSLNWQHSLCANPKQNPEIRTLLVDHVCRNAAEPSMQLTPPTNQLAVPGARPEGYIPVGATGSFETIRTWVSNLPVPHPPIVSRPRIALPGPSIPATTPREIVDLESDSPVVISPASDRMVNPVNDRGSASNGSTSHLSDELPMTVARTLNQGATPTSLHFHPAKQTLLLVGDAMGDFALWEVSTKEKVVSRSFQVWDIEKHSTILKALLVRDPRVSVKRVLWSPDGTIFGVGFSEHVVQLFTYSGGKNIRPHLEIDSHIGAVNDLAFCTPTRQLFLMTCGDDKSIKVWDVATGAKAFSFEGHSAPVHSICPHQKENVHFFFSTSVDGKIKAWLYDNMGSRVDYDAPGHSTAAMVYTADGKRLFSCGKAREGASILVEWNENEGIVKRIYQGLAKSSASIAQFDTTRSRYLVVGDEFSIKFWDMEHIHPVAVTKAGGGLLVLTTYMPPPPAATCIVFHPDDNNVLAVGMDDSIIQIYNVRENMVKHKLNGHSKRVTGLAFSYVLHALVSAADDSQIILWSTEKWEKRKSCPLQLPAGRATTSAANSGARLQYNFDQVHVLASNETQISIYDTIKLQCVKQWIIEESSPLITYATFSCDGELIYCSFRDGIIRVFGMPSLNLRCQINPSAYLPSESISTAYPLVVAAHPQEPNQFAVGLTDGYIHVVEPLESEGKWGQTNPALKNVASTSPASATPAVPVSDQALA
ncbi:protein TPR3-like [Carica papaya]|uniref:protein TPR3-like n=1 Tax=Carica papaya TaxID=3649 RepID=UPI000B8CF694|nr:protein TPR3-like [Carica papaya]